MDLATIVHGVITGCGQDASQDGYMDEAQQMLQLPKVIARSQGKEEKTKAQASIITSGNRSLPRDAVKLD